MNEHTSEGGKTKVGHGGCLLAVMAAVALGLGAIVVLLGLRKPWIEPVPGVSLTPSRPEMPRDRVDPESACGLYLRALDRYDANAAQILLNAATKLDGHPWPKPGALRPSKPAASPLSPPADDAAAPRPDTPWTAEEVKKVRAALPALEPVVVLARRAAAAPNPRIYTVTDCTEILSDLQGCKSFVLGLTVRARIRAAEGRLDDALDDLELALRFGNILAHGGCLIQNLVNVACISIALKTEWRLANAYPETPDQLRRQIRLLRKIEVDRDPFPEWIRYEWRVMRDIDWPKTFLPPKRPGKSPQRFLGALLLGMAGSSGEQISNDMSALYTHLAAAARQPDYENRRREFARIDANIARIRGKAFRYRDPVGAMIASMLVPSMDTLLVKYTNNLASLRCMQLFLAVKGWIAVHGGPPPTLTALVPEWLPHVPADPFLDGKPLHYRRLPNSTWAVYSLGPNRTDEKGTGQFFGYARITAAPPRPRKKEAPLTGRPGNSRSPLLGGSRPAIGPRAGDIVFPSVDFPAWWAELEREHAVPLLPKKTGPP